MTQPWSFGFGGLRCPCFLKSKIREMIYVLGVEIKVADMPCLRLRHEKLQG